MSYKRYKSWSFKENMHQASCSFLLSASRHCGQPKKEPQFPTSGSLHISPSWRQASGQTVEFDEKESMGG